MADVPLMSNPMTTQGDIVTGGASGAAGRLPIGTAGQVLTVNAGATAPEWGAGSGALTLIEEKILGSDGPIVFTSIPSTYKHLAVEARLRSTLAAATVSVCLRVGNGSIDTGSNYNYVWSRQGTTDSDTSSGSASEIQLVQVPGASDAVSDCFGIVEWKILHYANTSFWRVVQFRGGFVGTANQQCQGNGAWENKAAAIDTVSIVLTTGEDWLAGSAAWLYGIG